MDALVLEGFRSFAPCLPGYGATTPPPDYRIDTIAGLVAGLARVVGADVHLVGHDWGGIIACAAAALHPEAFGSVTAACCVHPAVLRSGRADVRQLRKSWYIGLFQIPGIERILGRRIVTRGLAPAADELGDPAAMARALEYYRTNLRPWALARSQAGRVRIPGLVIHARRDSALAESTMRRSAELFDDLHAFAILDCGHFIHRESPQSLVARLVEFFRTVESERD